MAMAVGSPDDDAEDQMNSTINTTPLVDVMLVLLIIFLITIPVVTQSIQLKLPEEKNVPTQTKPENILLAVSKDGDIYWNTRRIPDIDTLVADLKKESVKEPQPEVHIRMDKRARFEALADTLAVLQRGGMRKVGFIGEPPAGTGGG